MHYQFLNPEKIFFSVSGDIGHRVQSLVTRESPLEQEHVRTIRLHLNSQEENFQKSNHAILINAVGQLHF